MRIERPGNRHLPGPSNGILNRGRGFVTLDLKSEAGRAATAAAFSPWARSNRSSGPSSCPWPGSVRAGCPPRWTRAGWPEIRARIAARIGERARDDRAAVFAGSDACAVPALALSRGGAAGRRRRRLPC